MVKNYAASANEWSHLLPVDTIGDKPLRLKIAPDEQEKIDLARRLHVDELKDLSASITVSPVQGGVIHVTGRFSADVGQTCVVTLEPMESHLEEDFEGWFSDQAQMVSFAKVKKEKETQKAHAEVEILDESEDPEPVVNGKIDLGELVAQYLALAINRYPHKEGVAYETGDDNPQVLKADGTTRNPFEALKDWKEKR